ncbi:MULTISPECIES: DMT family transporter [unclassified Campylobacter]|uniref:DMT family transporter n=1 Tax=unclassified Campylobacter TaxID=2593542 RepID=UPI0012383626|nr:MULTISPECIES: DMT family transporter [unclassified Campylobacter]KAA6227281.1 DMT family transporter [Campylobacter sp. LR286c]KAA6227846.1 DMT family transporter [Campylobacter sp. LR185c]KAA6228254.1 DMT family transporter [Campylobacter sp. LR196d]KAA6229254.1 DMT family transporter [Campylobacter sp. LR291e]KAA6231060.1 DMT family transporter [Campylobacter sp. LR264d]
MLRIIKHNLSIYFMILACLDFAFMGACVKILSTDIPSVELMFFRNIIGLVFMLYLIKKSKVHKEGKHFLLLVFRGIFGTLSLYLFFYNVSNITLGGAFAFQKTAPIFISLIAFLFFKENIGIKGWLGIFIAFIGVLFIVQPFANDEIHTGFDFKNSSLGILSGFFAALALTSVRELRKFYTTEKIALSFIFIGTIMPLISMILGEFYHYEKFDFIIAAFVMPNIWEWFIIALMGCFGTLYQIHATKSYGIAKQAGIVAGISYLDVLFSLIVGIILGDNLPSFMVFIGILGIIVGGLILVIKKKKREK